MVVWDMMRRYTSCRYSRRSIFRLQLVWGGERSKAAHVPAILQPINPLIAKEGVTPVRQRGCLCGRRLTPGCSRVRRLVFQAILAATSWWGAGCLILAASQLSGRSSSIRLAGWDMMRRNMSSRYSSGLMFRLRQV